MSRLAQCPGCGAENPLDKKFCGDCGMSLLENACPSCGAKNEPGKKFCGDCGTYLRGRDSNPEQVLQNAQLAHNPVQRGAEMRLGLERIGRPALIVGSALFAMSLILYVLSNSLVDQAARLMREGDMRWADIANLSDKLQTIAWILFFVALVCVVVGAIAHMSRAK